MSKRQLALMLALAVLAPVSAGAVVPKQDEDPLASLAFVSERLTPGPEVEAVEDMQSIVASEVRDAWAAFRLGAPGEWSAYVDKRTGRIEAASGAGIPWIPGRGNQLQAGEAVDLVALEKIARGFLPRVAPLLGVKPDNLRLNRERSLRVADYLWRVDFDVLRGGLVVEGAYVAFTVNHGNLIQIEAANLPAPGARAPKVEVKRNQALSTLARYIGGFTAGDSFLDGGSYHLLPVALEDARFAEGYETGNGRGLAGVWQFTFRREGSHATWRARVDAVSGELLEMVDTNAYAEAYVRGGVMFGGVETSRPMPSANVIGAVPAVANSAGVYNYAGSPTSSTLNGPFVRSLDSCGLINEPSGPNGDIDFGLSPANNCSTPGHGGAGNTRSSRTQFFHLNRAKEVARGWFPANAWLNAKLTANVNINQFCNAFWNGATVNFYRSGGGCGNTGEIEEVSLHEYGHGFDQNDGNGFSLENGTGETYGDFTAALVSHTSCIGDGFRTTNCGGYGDPCLNCTGVRDIDWDAHASHTPHTVANFTQIRCPTSPIGYVGPCNREGHCESYISSEAVWDLAARDLPNPGSPAAWVVADRLWHLSRPSANRGFVCVTSTNPWTSHGCAAGTYWRAMRAVDDDDGNLANGTPHGGALFAAFNRHLIACTTDPGASVTFAACTPPPTPTLTLVPGDDQVSLSWTDSGAGIVYDVYRNDLGCGFGMAKVANDVAATSLLDTNVANDVTYSYQVVAHPAGNESCGAAATACQNVTPRHRTDVWSKDLPADVGLEPDPALAGQPMWQSPDIWVRNDLTPGPHQNPEFGQVNQVHVTVRNRSTVTALNVPVKVYYANASTGLAWPVDWTLIGTATIPSLAPAATTEITLPWSPPSTGHFCLLSRLDTPQDPMTFAETTNVDFNTRHNNNIAWKNVNVIDLVVNRAVRARFIFRNPDTAPRRARLLFRDASQQQVGHTFLKRGRVTVVLPETMVARMEEEGIEPQGFERVDDLTFEMADPEKAYFEVSLDGREEFPIGVVFTNTVFTTSHILVPVTYQIDAVGQDADTEEEIGGVAYLITAPQP